VIAGVGDTHTALWHLFDDPQLSATAGHFIDQVAAARHRIAVSSISLAEVVYLVEKNRLAAVGVRRFEGCAYRSGPRPQGSSVYGSDR
jgi:predicted nucleic acid-binding protein